jgi:hypothetical protein
MEAFRAEEQELLESLPPLNVPEQTLPREPEEDDDEVSMDLGLFDERGSSYKTSRGYHQHLHHHHHSSYGYHHSPQVGPLPQQQHTYNTPSKDVSLPSYMHQGHPQHHHHIHHDDRVQPPQPTPNQAKVKLPLKKLHPLLSPTYFREFMSSDPQKDDSSSSSPPSSNSYSQNQNQQQQQTQESIFKTISKRLLLLERNASLSYRYMEDTSRVYLDVFRRIEKLRDEVLEETVEYCSWTVRDYVSSL